MKDSRANNNQQVSYITLKNMNLKEYTQNKIDELLARQTPEDLLYHDDIWYYEAVVSEAFAAKKEKAEERTLVINSELANSQSRFPHPYPGPNNELTDFIDYINENNIKRVKITSEDLSFLNSVHSLDYVTVIPPDGIKKMDFSPLYGRDYIELTCANYEEYNQHVCGRIEIDRVNSVEFLYLKNKGDLILNKAIPGIKKLMLTSARLKNKNLESLAMSPTLEAINLLLCNIESIKGIEQLPDLIGLKLKWNHKLTDISALSECGDRLRYLWIENCGKITDFSCLYKLRNLEWLWLFGNNEVPDFEFLRQMPNLKHFAFSFHVKSGDISPCFSIPSAFSQVNRKEYHLKGRTLPHSKDIGASDDFWDL